MSKYNYKLDCWPSRQMCGMRTNGPEVMGVKVTHTPTGVFVCMKDHRSRYENKYHAIKELEILVDEHYAYAENSNINLRTVGFHGARP